MRLELQGDRGGDAPAQILLLLLLNVSPPAHVGPRHGRVASLSDAQQQVAQARPHARPARRMMSPLLSPKRRGPRRGGASAVAATHSCELLVTLLLTAAAAVATAERQERALPGNVGALVRGEPVCRGNVWTEVSVEAISAGEKMPEVQCWRKPPCIKGTSWATLDRCRAHHSRPAVTHAALAAPTLRGQRRRLHGRSWGGCHADDADACAGERPRDTDWPTWDPHLTDDGTLTPFRTLVETHLRRVRPLSAAPLAVACALPITPRPAGRRAATRRSCGRAIPS